MFSEPWGHVREAKQHPGTLARAGCWHRSPWGPHRASRGWETGPLQLDLAWELPGAMGPGSFFGDLPGGPGATALALEESEGNLRGVVQSGAVRGGLTRLLAAK